jgi:hypothetical protein
MHSPGTSISDPRPRESGIALLIALIALSLFSILSLIVCLSATASLRTCGNSESLTRARSAAMAGLAHARALLAGLRFDDLLRGPDGVFDAGPAYLAEARTQAFRSPVGLGAARLLDLRDPAAWLGASPDDGLMNTGRHPAGDGLILIPAGGVAQVEPGPGPAVASRYWVKVSDNNGDASELAGDPDDNPFVDGDGLILVRSMGIARLIDENTSGGTRKNSVAVFEARFKRLSTFELDAPVEVQTSQLEPAAAEVFAGALFSIQGGGLQPGIAVIDTDAGDGVAPAREALRRMTPEQGARILGQGLEASVRDVTDAVSAHPDRRLLLDRNYVWSFLGHSVPRFADAVLDGNQTWAGGAPVPLGRHLPALPPAAPGQDPRVTLVRGDLQIDGDVQGAGLLAVTGKLTVNGRFDFQGIVLVAGAGEAEIGGTGTISGSLYVARWSDAAGQPAWGTARLTIRDSVRIEFDRASVQMAVSLIPPKQVGFREIQRP